MNKDLIIKKYKKQIKSLNYYNKKYYNDNTSQITDSEYDKPNHLTIHIVTNKPVPDEKDPFRVPIKNIINLIAWNPNIVIYAMHGILITYPMLTGMESIIQQVYVILVGIFSKSVITNPIS